jgi:hypothetical protein
MPHYTVRYTVDGSVKTRYGIDLLNLADLCEDLHYMFAEGHDVNIIYVREVRA